jgi:hypothetical protein
MSKNPVNLALRFLLELTAIVVFGAWGYALGEGGLRFLYALLLIMLFAVLWGVFAVKGDPSRSGKTVVQTPGLLRLILELVLFGAASWMLFQLGSSLVGWIFSGLVFTHYIISYDRIDWLLKQK